MTSRVDPREDGPRMAESTGFPRSKTLFGEVKVVARALTASTAGTFVDGLLYQAVLFMAEERYATAALAGAAFGALTNFFLGRAWAFPNARRSVLPQLGLYALGSLLTYLALHASLLVLVERLGVDPRLAWPPGKVMAWILVSYPFQRLVVFRGVRR